jgi:hypothetical protein
MKYGAGNGVRTRDTKFGKLVLYQLSYARLCLRPSFALIDIRKTEQRNDYFLENIGLKNTIRCFIVKSY